MNFCRLIGTNAPKVEELVKNSKHDSFKKAQIRDETPTPSPYEVYVNNERTVVFATANSDFTQIVTTDVVNVKVLCDNIKTVEIRPSRLNISFKKTQNCVSFDVNPGEYLSVEINGIDRPLFIFSDAPIKIPRIEGYKTMSYQDGEEFDIGLTELSDNTIIYIGHNTVLHGCFLAKNKKNIKIIGPGIIDGTAFRNEITFQNCENIEINGPICVGYYGWNVRIFNVIGGEILNHKILATGLTSDGIDILGSQNINVKHIFVRNEDDCVVIKTKKMSSVTAPVEGDVKNITVDGCVLWCGFRGNGLEIGYELDDYEVTNVLFKNVDIIHRQTAPHPFNRGTITIHNAGSGRVHNITYDNIYVESTQENFVFFSHILFDNWGKSGGSIENITVKNLTLAGGKDAPSYIVSKTDENKLPLSGIVFENLTYKGQKIKSIEDAKKCGFTIDDHADVTFK